jgi:membrane protein implicated in regulation of membrane protease activity
MREDGFFKAVANIVNKILEKKKFNYCEEGRIIQNNNNGTYEVKINNDTSTIKAMNSDTYNAGDIVKILIINNNYSEKYILCKR